MKLGIEVEGRLRGIPTIFVDACEFGADLATKASHYFVSHVYISDRDNSLDLSNVGEVLNEFLVTVERTKVPTNLPRNVTIMLYVEGFEEVNKLRPTDQVKFENAQHVFTSPKSSFDETLPEEFKDDTIL